MKIMFFILLFVTAVFGVVLAVIGGAGQVREIDERIPVVGKIGIGLLMAAVFLSLLTLIFGRGGV